MDGSRLGASRRGIPASRRSALLLLVLLAGVGCRSGKWAWELSDKEKRIDYLKAQEAPAVQRPTPCMEALEALLNCLARKS